MDLSLTYYGDPVLRKKSRKVTTFGEPLRELAESMLRVMREAEGIGLAAQQVGLTDRICVVDLGEGAKADPSGQTLDGKAVPAPLLMPLVTVNPEVIESSPENDSYEEGCLSIPGVRASVVRPDAISVRYWDLEGVEHRLEATGLLARCLQHEFDHLEGILFVDRIKAADRLRLAGKLRQLKRETKRASREKN